MKDLAILAKYSAVHWYCPKCENDTLQKQGMTIMKSLKTLNQWYNNESEIRKQETDLLMSINTDIEIIKEKTPSGNTYAEKAKIARKPSPSTRQQIPRNKEKDLSTILIVSGNQKYRDSIEIKRAFSKIFPMKKLIVAVNTARGNIHLEFLNSQEADEVFSNWKADYLGTKTSIRKASARGEQRNAVIKGVPKEIEEVHITEILQKKYPGISAKRFVKADGTILQTVKLTFQSELQYNNALSEGLFLDSIYYQPYAFVQRGIRIIRCYNCQQFGHLSGNCHSKTACKHCSEDHKIEDCPNKELESKCMNCRGTHDAVSLVCPTYTKQKQVVYDARGLTDENHDGWHDGS